MNFGNIKNIQMHSPLDGLSQVRPKGMDRSMAAVVAPLMLTSLVDAFAVIVIYLLMSTTNGTKNIDTEKGIKLPVAQKAQALEAGVNLRVVKNQYFVDENPMTLPELLKYLKTTEKEFLASGDPRRGNLIVQADKNADYKALSPVLSVASQSGFHKIKFATLGD